jgi:ATP-dependent Zn protease
MEKNRLMNAQEKEIVAFHEPGHAIVAESVEHADPVHKISIIPRGFAALGYTQQQPTEDRYLMTRSELLDRLVYCVKSPFTLIVIPGLTRNPVFPGWIPAFAGMTVSELM